jgi:RTX calcium-binding nonapeptide repeat (4 copies)
MQRRPGLDWQANGTLDVGHSWAMTETSLTTMRCVLVVGIAAMACSVPSPPAERPGTRLERSPIPDPLADRTPPPLPPSDRLCSTECCPRGTPIVELGSSASPARNANTSACLVGDGNANAIAGGARGDVIVAGDGNDIVHGAGMRDTILGDDGDDEIHAAGGSDHIDGGFGDDLIEGGDHADLVLGGPGADMIFGDVRDALVAHPGADVIHGGPGSDTIDGGPGEDRILGGVDDDTLAGGPGNDIILGGLGEDEITGGDDDDHIESGPGDDVIHGGEGRDWMRPGLGRDEVYGEGGDDTFVVMDECELSAGEIIDGGPGYDTIHSSWSESELLERGVRVSGIERFSNPRLGVGKVCELENPNHQMIEVSGTVVATDVLFRDEQGSFRPLDGQFHTEWDIITKHRLAIDTVYLGRLEAGAEIEVILPGGSIELPDGTGRTSIGCCFKELVEGRRYRLELREALDAQGSRVGWDYIWYPSTALHHALVLPLAARGPISMAAAGPREGVGPMCPGVPLPGTFKTNREAIVWANTQGYRWDQTVRVCDGPPPCLVAAPPASIDHNMTQPQDCPEQQTFGAVFGDAARVMSAGAIIQGTWGVHAPGVTTNPTSLAKCDTSKNDDSRSCIALDEPRPDLGGADDQRNIGGLNGRTEVRKKATMKSLSWPTLTEIQEIDITFRADLPYGDVCELYTGDFSFSPLVTHELG